MRIRRQSLGYLFGFLLAAAGLLALPGTARAQGDLFAVHDIPVDATEEDANSAREAALANGYLEAWDNLLARIVPREQLLNVPDLAPEQITELVRGFSVADERTSPVRYLAVLTIRFNPEAVRQFLGQHDIPFAQTRSKPVLVLPVFTGGGAVRLWRHPNPWREVWSSRRLDNELVPMIVPLGDVEDVGAIDADQALDGDSVRLDTLARRYGTEEAMVVQLIEGGNPGAGRAKMDVIVRRYLSVGDREPSYQTYRQQSGESRKALLARAAEGVVGSIREAWKTDNLLRLRERKSLMATVPVDSLSEWLEVKRRLDEVASIVDSNLAYMTRGSVDLMITFIGNEAQLARALAQKSLRLTPDATAGWWQLSLSSGVPPSAGQPSVE